MEAKLWERPMVEVQVRQAEVTLSNDKGESQREDASPRVKDLKKNSLWNPK